MAAVQPSLLPRLLLYCGITEEIIARWGIMSAVVWAAWHLAGRPELISPSVYWIGIAVSALLFAAMHLPLLFAFISASPSWLVLTILIGNTLAGALFGWLFWRRGLEAAITAHALARLLAYSFETFAPAAWYTDYRLAGLVRLTGARD